jgi:putative acetyltransferase
MPLTIAIEAPRQNEVLDLLRQSDDYAFSLYPADSCYLLNVAELEAANVSVFVARTDEAQVDVAGVSPAVDVAGPPAAVGIAALSRNTDGTAELKRVFVTAAARGRGIARSILRAVEDVARAEGMSAIVLETGPAQPEAIALYESHGYGHIPRFGQYVDDELSVCMKKTLSPSSGQERA